MKEESAGVDGRLGGGAAVTHCDLWHRFPRAFTYPLVDVGFPFLHFFIVVNKTMLIHGNDHLWASEPVSLVPRPIW